MILTSGISVYWQYLSSYRAPPGGTSSNLHLVFVSVMFYLSVNIIYTILYYTIEMEINKMEINIKIAEANL